MSKAVPEGWTIQTLDGKVHILSGFPFKSSLFTDDPDFMGIIRIRDLEKQSIETFYAGDFDETYVVRRGDVLIGMDGDFNIVKWNAKNALLNQRVCKVKAEADSSFDTDFLFQSLKDDLLSINAATGATTVKHLSVKDIRGIEKAFPPLPEQQKIATILSSVDNVIEKTRTQIDKLKYLKTGMMQELLTKGIGHTEFKNSELGDIPLTWDVKLLGEVYPKIVVGYVGNVNDFYCEKDNGVPFYRTLNIRDGFIRNDPVKYVTKEFNEKNKKSQIFNDDILIARVGANLGMTCKVTGLESSANIANAIIIKSVKNASSDFFMEYIRSDYGQKQIMSEAAGGAQGVFNTSLAQGLVVPVPPLSEQIEIGRKLISFDKYIKLSETKMSCFLALKKALMQDLLTGKVRVNTKKEVLQDVE